MTRETPNGFSSPAELLHFLTVNNIPYLCRQELTTKTKLLKSVSLHTISLACLSFSHPGTPLSTTPTLGFRSFTGTFSSLLNMLNLVIKGIAAFVEPTENL